jgi:hypothetical protein
MSRVENQYQRSIEDITEEIKERNNIAKIGKDPKAKRRRLTVLN